MNKRYLHKFAIAVVLFQCLLLSSILNAQTSDLTEQENRQGLDNQPADIQAADNQPADNQTALNQDASKQASSVKREYAENYVFADPHQRKNFLELTAVLRCPKCQNQSIADSDAPIAHDMRRKVYQLMQKGEDKSQVIDWMKERYGDFVYYQPPLNYVTIWLWIMPALFAAIMLLFFIRRRKPEYDQDTEAKLAKADQILKED